MRRRILVPDDSAVGNWPLSRMREEMQHRKRRGGPALTKTHTPHPKKWDIFIRPRPVFCNTQPGISDQMLGKYQTP